jgi:uncharacterized surface protein with fasciclin (FAS1) repeats
MNIKLAVVGGIAALLVLTGCSIESDNVEAAAETTSASPSPSESESESEAPAEEPGTIVDVAAGNPDFETLVAAVTAADLVETLSGDGPFTVFAPTNEAFAALPDGLLDALLLPENKDALTSILTYHVLPAEVMAADVTAGEVATVEGSMIDITTDDGVMVNDATVITTDVEASNGVIHAIDAVLVPPSVDVNALLN